jgi:hypothetical protein
MVIIPSIAQQKVARIFPTNCRGGYCFVRKPTFRFLARLTVERIVWTATGEKNVSLWPVALSELKHHTDDSRRRVIHLWFGKVSGIDVVEGGV